MKILSVGHCPLCTTEIYKKKRLPFIQYTASGAVFNFKKVPYALNDKGATFWILETSGSRMEVSICKRCLSYLTDEQVSEIYGNIIYTKLKTVKDTKLYNLIRTLDVFLWRNTEKEIADYLQALDFKGQDAKQNHSTG